MGDNALSNRIGAAETKIGILEHSLGNIEKAQDSIRDDQRRIFKKMENDQRYMGEKMDTVKDTLVEKIDAGIHNCTKETIIEEHGQRLVTVEGKVQNGIVAGAVAKGWVKAFEWIIRIILAVVGLYFTYIAIKHGIKL